MCTVDTIVSLIIFLPLIIAKVGGCYTDNRTTIGAVVRVRRRFLVVKECCQRIIHLEIGVNYVVSVAHQVGCAVEEKV